MQRSILWGGFLAASVAVAATIFLPGARFAPKAATTVAGSTRTITVIGSAAAPTPISASQDQLFINLSATGNGSLGSAMTQLQTQANAVIKAMEQAGISSSAISQPNLNLYWNSQTFKGKVPSGQNANETLSATVPSQDGEKIFTALAQLLAQLPRAKGNGNNISLNPSSPNGSLNAPAEAINAAMAAATQEATAIAHRMGVTLGAIEAVRQEPPAVNACQCPSPSSNVVSLKVSFLTHTP